VATPFTNRAEVISMCLEEKEEVVIVCVAFFEKVNLILMKEQL
jgi:hypothetical protein